MGGEPIKLVIIRHPETNKIAGLDGEQDAPSPKGLTQLSRIEKACRKEGAEAVIHSTLPRATISAEDLAKMLGVLSIVQEGIQERYFGKWESWGWPKISVELNKLSLESRYTFKPTGGESWQDMEVRIRSALNDIAALEYDTVAIMTHAGVIRVLLNVLGVKSKGSTINFIPALGSCIIENFDISSL